MRQLSNGKYLVVEGNRRVACLNYLQGRYDKEGYDLGNLDPIIFSRLPVVYYTDPNDIDHLVLMGLKHISGNKKWPTINQATLIRDLSEKYKMTPDDVCQSIGISKQEFLGTLNTLALIDEYQKSNYGDQFSSEKYSFFREIVKSPKIKSWLDWNDENKTANNRRNLNRLFSWLSIEPTEIIENEEDESSLANYNHELEPVISRAAQIRELAKIVEDQNALDVLDSTRNLTDATLGSEVLSKDKTKNAITTIEKETTALFDLLKYIDEPERQMIYELSRKLQGIVEINNTQDLSSGISYQYYFERTELHFTSVRVEQFRRFNQVNFKNFGRINIFAGINNSGKTTILEAIKLLTSLNSPSNFIDLISQRAKQTATQLDMDWFVDQLPNVKIEGNFNNSKISLSISQMINTKIDDKMFYLKSSLFDVNINESSFKSQTHYYKKYQPRTDGQIISLCPSILSSPYTLQDIITIEDCFSKSLKNNSRDIIVEFIQKNMDSKIRNIEKDKKHRFVVIHDIIKPNPDLTIFGEGLQRVFKIGLLFAYAENGVVLIDEFENAIHASLLPKFVVLLDNLAKKFNVQVFLTTHSKECINAFINNSEIDKKTISSYSLVNVGHKIEVEYFPGEKLAELMDSFDFDIRGGKIE